jgi:beta-lactamase superfamily II metal-dependent hydrolase
MPKSACLEIHQINVGQGDSTLIINRDLAKVQAALEKAKLTLPADPIDWVPLAVLNKETVSLVGTVKKALLIDAGDDEYGGDVLAYMTAQGVLDGKTTWYPDLMLMVSHYHDDHMAGLRSIFKERIDPKKKGDKVTYKERIRPGIVYQSLRYKKMDPKTQRFKLFQEDLEDAATGGSKKTKVIEIGPGGLDTGTGKPTVISLGTGAGGIPIGIVVVSAGQSVYNTASGLQAIKGLSSTPDQNDRSIAAMLQYGSFRYFFGGDLAGSGVAAGGNFGVNAMDPSKKKATSRHADVESTLGPALEAGFPATPDSGYTAGKPKFTTRGYATVMKANHHGSSSSDDVYLFATLQPAVFLLSSGIKSRYHSHPTQQVINRADAATETWGRRGTPLQKAGSVTVKNSIKQIYITEMAEQVKGKTFAVDEANARIMGDIIVRPIDETVTAVQQATASGAVLTVQVYGMGDLTKLFDPATTLRDTSTTKVDKYPIGPWEHSDTH